MKISLFYHSVISDWNNGNAHFLRGIVSALLAFGCEVRVMEPEDGWSLKNLYLEKGESVLTEFGKIFPDHMPRFYPVSNFNPGEYIGDADLVIVHEWNDPDVVARIGEYRAEHEDMILLFHDTHHRSVTKPADMELYDLRHYDGVLAFGEVIRKIYIENGWTHNAWTWHEAADDRIFGPLPRVMKEGDLVWIGNWGDNERSEELKEFIIDPVKEMGLNASFFGVRYPPEANKILEQAGINYGGWVPNYLVPEIFSKYRVTVHVPRRPYTNLLPGIPTIRPFESLACGIPLICSPWEDTERLFTPGKDFLVAGNRKQMKKHLSRILTDRNYAETLAGKGMRTIRKRHTCDHRAGELLTIVRLIQATRMKNKKIAIPEFGF